MATDTGPQRAVSAHPLAYLPPVDLEFASDLLKVWDNWVDHRGTIDLVTWSGRAAGLLTKLITDTATGGVPQ